MSEGIGKILERVNHRESHLLVSNQIALTQFTERNQTSLGQMSQENELSPQKNKTENSIISGI